MQLSVKINKKAYELLAATVGEGDLGICVTH